jgi:hypothetical protein
VEERAAWVHVIWLARYNVPARTQLKEVGPMRRLISGLTLALALVIPPAAARQANARVNPSAAQHAVGAMTISRFYITTKAAYDVWLPQAACRYRRYHDHRLVSGTPTRSPVCTGAGAMTRKNRQKHRQFVWPFAPWSRCQTSGFLA